VQALGEAGVRGFSRPGVESSSLYDNTVGAVFPQPAEFFFIMLSVLVYDGLHQVYQQDNYNTRLKIYYLIRFLI